MKVAVLFSGGKDSVMSLYHALEAGEDVCYLLSMKSLNDESYMFHVPNIHLTDLSSKALNIPLRVANTNGVKEEELQDLKEQLIFLKNEGVEAIYTGALYSVYQKSRIEKLASEVELEVFSPYWHVDELEYMKNIVSLGFEVVISGVFAEGLDESWLGRKLDDRAIEELIEINKKYHINLAFEGGEAETLVIDGPIFEKRINILKARKEWNFDNGVFIVEDAVLEEK